jgi:nucleotide-binding universal stress UspA family protein
VALPLDHQTDDLVTAALDFAKRAACPVVVVHALGKRTAESERATADRLAQAKADLQPRLASLVAAGLDLRVEVAVAPPAELTIATAQRVGAQLIVTGGGQRATISRWLVGSVAEAIAYRAVVPVWVVRGALAPAQPILCPSDFSPASQAGLGIAVRMARLYSAPLRLFTVLSDEETAPDAAAIEAARQRLQAPLAHHAVEGLHVDVQVLVGDPAVRIVEAAADAGMLVIGSPGFDPLAQAWLGPVTRRALRHSACSVLAVRQVHDDLQRGVGRVAELAQACRATWELIADNRAAEALPVIEAAAQRAPFNAAIQEAYATVLERMGRDVEARARHELATLIRENIDRPR